MGSLYLDRKALELGLDGGLMVIAEPGERPRTVPLKLLERVVVRGQATIDTRLLGALAEQGTPLLCLSGRHGRRTAIVLGEGHADGRRRLAQYRLCQDEGVKLAFARGLVAGKLQAQQRLLEAALAARPDARKPLFDGAQALAGVLGALAAADTLDAVRGFEGAGAARYFAALTALFPDSLGFSGRNRRPPRDPVNACLSLGYTLLHAEAVGACHAAGLDPLLGFLHEPSYKRESLACDLVEPLRPRLDALVWTLFRERALAAEHFAADKGACLLGKTGRQTFYARYELAARPWRRWLRRQAHALARRLLEAAPLLEGAA